MRSDSYDVVVIGAGLVGAAVAYGLVCAGQRVALLDEDDATYRASRGNFGLVWVQGKGVGRPEYALWSRASSERWFALADALSEDCGLSPSYLRPGGVSVALSEDELGDLDSMLAGLRHAAGNAVTTTRFWIPPGFASCCRRAGRRSPAASTPPTTATPTRSS